MAILRGLLQLAMLQEVSLASADVMACSGDADVAASCAASGQSSLLQKKHSTGFQESEGTEDDVDDAVMQAVQSSMKSEESIDNLLAQPVGDDDEEEEEADCSGLREKLEKSEQIMQEVEKRLEKCERRQKKRKEEEKIVPLEPEVRAAPVTSSGCTPVCRWSCSSPECEEVCAPECEQPICETRCSKVNLAGCKLECDQPECYTVCPKKFCAKKSCPSCSTNCSDPRCKLKCPQEQSCKALCETPKCKWNCRRPEQCPKPVCKMECEEVKSCMRMVGKKIPPLQKGELKVASFSPPSSFLQVMPGARHAAGALKGKEVSLPVLVESADEAAKVIELPVSS